jgi:DeoR/GlpR family transcriptional regulator of sugar metabolism
MNNFLLKLAVTLVGDNTTTVNIPNLTDAQVLHNGLNIAYFLAGTIAVIVIIVGGIMYVTAAGNSGNITKAKNMLLYAVIGLVTIIAAYAITNFVIVRFN